MDEAIKKVKVPVNLLPPLANDEEYLLRYRVISEDQNRTSAWSPVVSFNVEFGINVLDGGVES